jgi:hypothetical protein
MARPQSPELRRSGTTPALEPDNIGSRLEARRQPKASGNAGPVPEDNQPGHHPPQDQDKPDLDAFAEKFNSSVPVDPGTDDLESDPTRPTPAQRGFCPGAVLGSVVRTSGRAAVSVVRFGTGASGVVVSAVLARVRDRSGPRYDDL